VIDATLKVEKQPAPEYLFPHDWSCTLHDRAEMDDLMQKGNGRLSLTRMKSEFGWGGVTGVTSASLWLRPDVEHARRGKSITKAEILRSGIPGVHFFVDLRSAKAYFRAHFKYEALPIAAHKLRYLQFLINASIKIDTCSICLEQLGSSSTTVTLPCRHTFCYNCTLDLIRSRDNNVDDQEQQEVILKCPNCRSHITYAMVQQHAIASADMSSSSSSNSSME
jgi:hypothetical protein